MTNNVKQSNMQGNWESLMSYDSANGFIINNSDFDSRNTSNSRDVKFFLSRSQ